MNPQQSHKKCIIVAGPTAVGKTAYAIALAKQYNTSIISADSRQCYTEMNIGVAKPSSEELASAPHYFINTLHIEQPFSAADYETYALETANKLFQTHDTIVMVGGTGLYIKAFTDGLDPLPPVDIAVRSSLNELFEEKGLEGLQQLLQEKDPLYFNEGEVQNPRRVMRALEVVLTTGQSIKTFQVGAAQKRDFAIEKIVLEMPREELYNRINLRVDKMMEAGLLEEAKALYPMRHLNALQTVGYRELFQYFDGTLTLADAVALIKQNTRHYAKRQMTWFRKEGFTGQSV